MRNSLIIHYHGEIKYSEEENNILISEDDSWKGEFINKQLQIDYLKIDDYIKASQVVNQEFGEINNIKIINHNYDLNMISYQYDYEMIKKNYQMLGNLIFFIGLSRNWILRAGAVFVSWKEAINLFLSLAITVRFVPQRLFC